MRYITVAGTDEPAVVDDEDYERAAVFAWRLDHLGRVVTYTPDGRLFMARLIVGAAKREINRRVSDPFDNTRRNLHMCDAPPSNRCRNGHPRTDDNTIRYTYGTRVKLVCKDCAQERLNGRR